MYLRRLRVRDPYHQDAEGKVNHKVHVGWVVVHLSGTQQRKEQPTNQQ